MLSDFDCDTSGLRFEILPSLGLGGTAEAVPFPTPFTADAR
jgi:hypothetical protein